MRSWVIWIDVIWILAGLTIRQRIWSLPHRRMTIITINYFRRNIWLERMSIIHILVFGQILSRCRHLRNLWLTKLWVTIDFILQLIICIPLLMCTFRRVDWCQWLNLFGFPSCLYSLGRLIRVDIYLLFLSKTVNSSTISFNFGSSLTAALLWRHVFVRSHVWISKTESLLLVTFDFDFIVAVYLNPFGTPYISRDYFPNFAVVSLAALSIKATESRPSRWFDDKRRTFN